MSDSETTPEAPPPGSVFATATSTTGTCATLAFRCDCRDNAPWKISYDWEGGGQLESMETNVEQLYEGGEWSFKNSGSRKILVEFHESRSLVSFSVYVRLAVSFFI